MKKLLLGSILLLCLRICFASVDTVSIYSNSLHKQVKFVIVQPKQNKTALPTVYLLHGYSGNYAGWVNLAPQLQDKADLLQINIVCPDGANSWYYDSPIDSTIRYESYIIKDLVPYIDQHYSTIADKSKRAITGLSMGGHGGLYLSIRHTDIFGAGGSTSGGVDIRPFPNNWEIKKALGEYEKNQSLWDSNTVMTLVEGLKNNQLKIIVDCGLDDFFLKVNRSLHEKLQALKIDHDYIERPGAHNAAYWKNSIDYQLLFFKKYFDSKN
ncbi:MAG: alpha/beta hydrolase family protein [Bacteroidetes bacterium]|nr:alpha/beta hydrolase family protein [Bacteroidota bacterium]